MILLVYLLVILFFVVILSYQVYNYIKDGILFQPVEDHSWFPEEPYPEEVWLYNNKIHGWFFEAERGRPVVLFCHGNTGNISHRRYVIELCKKLNLSLFIFDYRGYGFSKGVPNLNSICGDGEVAYAYLVGRGYTSSNIIIWGESLGGAVAIHVASKERCNRLLLMATFSSLSDLAWDSGTFIGKVAYPFIKWEDCSNIEKIKRVTCPVFIAHSEEDDLIPFIHSTRLHAAVPHNWKKLITLKGRHGMPVVTPNLFEDILEFSWIEPSVPDECQSIFNYISEVPQKHGV